MLESFNAPSLTCLARSQFPRSVRVILNRSVVRRNWRLYSCLGFLRLRSAAGHCRQARSTWRYSTASVRGRPVKGWTGTPCRAWHPCICRSIRPRPARLPCTSIPPESGSSCFHKNNLRGGNDIRLGLFLAGLTAASAIKKQSILCRRFVSARAYSSRESRDPCHNLRYFTMSSFPDVIAQLLALHISASDKQPFHRFHCFAVRKHARLQIALWQLQLRRQHAFEQRAQVGGGTQVAAFVECGCA